MGQTALTAEPSATARAVDRDAGFRRRLLQQFDDGAEALRGLMADRFGTAGVDGIVVAARTEGAEELAPVRTLGDSAPRGAST